MLSKIISLALNRRLGFFLFGHGTMSLLLVGRDLFVAYIWGTTEPISNFMAALILPVIIMSVAANSLSSVLLSRYLKNKKVMPESDLRGFINNIFGLTIVTFASLFLLSLSVTWNQQDAIYLAIYGLIFAITAVPRTVLIAEGQDRPILIAPIIALIIGLIFLDLTYQSTGIRALALAYVTIAAVEFAILMIALRRRGLGLSFCMGRLNDFVLFRNEFSFVATSSILMSISIAIDQAIARSIGTNSLPHFNYATKIPAMVIGIGSGILSLYFYPRITTLIAEAKQDALKSHLKTFFIIIFGFLLPVCLLGVIFSNSIVQMIFERGAFSSDDTYAVGDVQKFLLLQLPPYFICILASQMLVTLGRAKFIFQVAILNTALKAMASVGLAQAFGLPGIGLANFLVQTTLALVLCLTVAQETRMMKFNHDVQVK